MDLTKPVVSVLIPAHNEEKFISDTVKGLVEIPEVTEIIVVDDASGDQTGALAQEAGAYVLRLERNIGKGGALNTGMKMLKGNIIVLVDGDLGMTSREARKLILPVLLGEADMTIARFPKAKKKGGLGLVKGLARLGIKFYTGLEVNAPLSGQRAMTRDVFEVLGPFESGYGVEVGLTIAVARKGFRVQEVETEMGHAETGRDFSGFLHRGKQFLHVLKVLVKVMYSR